MVVDGLAGRLIVLQNAPCFVLTGEIVHAQPEKGFHIGKLRSRNIKQINTEYSRIGIGGVMPPPTPPGVRVRTTAVRLVKLSC